MKIAEHGPDLASLQQLVDSVPALIHTARPDGSIAFFNQCWLEFVGLRLEDLEDRKWFLAATDTGVGTGSTLTGWVIQQFGFRAAFGAAVALAAISVSYFIPVHRTLRSHG